MEEVLVQSPADGRDDLLMECDEEEQEVWPQVPERNKEEEKEKTEEQHDEALQAAVHPMEEETEPPLVRIVPLPVLPESSSSSPPRIINTQQCSSGPLGFRVNGLLVSLLPGGGGAELTLRSHPGGSASGFTTVQVPAVEPSRTPDVKKPAWNHHINAIASLTASLTVAPPPPPPPAAPEPEADPTPIITGVISGEEAQRILSDSVNFISSPPPTAQKSPPTPSPRTLTSPRTTPPASHLTKAPPRSSGRAAKTQQKGEPGGPVSPPDCPICMSQYKLITELRGFMCLCSPVIAQSLKNLRRKYNQRRRSREKNRTPRSSSKGSRTRPGPPALTVLSPSARSHCRLSDDFLSDEFTRPGPPSTTACGPQQHQCDPPPGPLRGKLVIMVEDFYYGSAPGRSSFRTSHPGPRCSGPYHCIHCLQAVRNNIELMRHMKEHMTTMSQQDRHMDNVFSCPHCFRHFTSPFKLQCHVEAVHSQYESTAQCKICELEFGSEPVFLSHMKNTHKPGEMPYSCQVCDFRSSFFSDVWSHFEQVHADTNYLMCQYCLKVLRKKNCYQQHFARHQKKQVFSCNKCRLHFLYLKERVEHKLQHHRTHIRPPQLTGLKPGTKVTVRTYSVVRGSQDEHRPKKPARCKVVDVDLPPPKQEAPRRRPVESLRPLLCKLSQESEAADVSRPSLCCVECLSPFQDFSSHFPSLVHCSLCKFVTCCSTSYANHMINNHSASRKVPQYCSIFQSDHRLSHRLRCVSCKFSTFKGDVMANHLSDRPQHYCITHNESRINGAEATNTRPTHSSVSVTSPVRGGGAFIPIHLLPKGQASTQLSVKALTSPSPLSSPPAMTIKFLGPRPPPAKIPVPPLSVHQLSAVLSSLCHGVSEASRRHRTNPSTLQWWIRLQRRRLEDKKWCWRTEKAAVWVLSQREQQLSVSEDVLLQTARRALGEDGERTEECFRWSVDFLLRHELGLQSAPTDNHRGRLPKSIRDNSQAFIRSLSEEFHLQHVPPHGLASMDEFSIFIDPVQFSEQNPLALRLFGSPEDVPVFDVILGAVSDGTFLPPLLFFRGTSSSHVPEGFPENVLLEAGRDGFSDQDRLQTWINKVWRPHVASQSKGESVLLADIHRGHLTHEFTSSLTSMSTDVVFIPSGCSCRLQPLDVCVTPVLRDFLQARWTQLVSQGGLDGFGLDQLALTLACWLSEVSSTLNSEPDLLRRSFTSVCDLQQLEDRREALRMIQTLTEALVQTSGPPEPEPEPELELLLVMEEQQQEEVQEEQQEEVLKSPSALHLVLDEEQDLQAD